MDKVLPGTLYLTVLLYLTLSTQINFQCVVFIKISKTLMGRFWYDVFCETHSMYGGILVAYEPYNIVKTICKMVYAILAVLCFRPILTSFTIVQKRYKKLKGVAATNTSYDIAMDQKEPLTV